MLAFEGNTRDSMSLSSSNPNPFDKFEHVDNAYAQSHDFISPNSSTPIVHFFVHPFIHPASISQPPSSPQHLNIFRKVRLLQSHTVQNLAQMSLLNSLALASNLHQQNT